MLQLLKEILVLLLIAPICIGFFIFAMYKAEQSRQIDTLSASIEKKDLTIGSPVFGTIEEFPVDEGDIVKANKTLAVINIIDQKDSSQRNSDVYEYNEEKEVVIIKSPVDAIVAKKELAEKSTIKPEANLITLHPLSQTNIKISSREELTVSSYDTVYLTDKNSSFSYPVDFSEKLPVSDKNGTIYYTASFVDKNLANKFYENQQVIIKAKKKTNAFTGRLDSFFSHLRFNTLVEKLPFEVNI